MTPANSLQPERQPSTGEEIASSVSHGAGLLAFLVACPLLIARAVEHAKPGGVLATSIFAAAIVLLYLALAWLIVVAIRPLMLALPRAGVGWLLAGGVVYTIGMVFFAARWLPYGHLVWHLFVLAGTACHLIAVWAYLV